MPAGPRPPCGPDRAALYAELREGGESVAAIMTALCAVLERYGLPMALYTDRAHWPRVQARPYSRTVHRGC